MTVLAIMAVVAGLPFAAYYALQSYLLWKHIEQTKVLEEEHRRVLSEGPLGVSPHQRAQQAILARERFDA